MRSPYEDYTLLVEAGFWNDPRDPLMNAVTLLCMHAKARHRPVRNLHHLADAVAEGDPRSVKKYHARLSDEVSRTLRKYPDIEGTLRTMSQMTDDDMDRLVETFVAAARLAWESLRAQPARSALAIGGVVIGSLVTGAIAWSWSIAENSDVEIEDAVNVQTKPGGSPQPSPSVSPTASPSVNF